MQRIPICEVEGGISLHAPSMYAKLINHHKVSVHEISNVKLMLYQGSLCSPLNLELITISYHLESRGRQIYW